MNIEAYVANLQASRKNVKMSGLKLARLYCQAQKDVLYEYAEALENAMEADKTDDQMTQSSVQDVLDWASHKHVTMNEKHHARDLAAVTVDGDTLARLCYQAKRDALNEYANTLDSAGDMTDEATEQILQAAMEDVCTWAKRHYPTDAEKKSELRLSA